MRIAFVSTILGYPWGGADTLWTHTAEAANSRGDDLLISVSSAVARNPRVTALVKAGARLHERAPAPLSSSLGARVAGKIYRALGRGGDGLVGELAAFHPGLVVISLGGTYDLVLHSDWVEWLAATGTRVRLIANWQEENPVLTESACRAARRALMLAEQICFVSTRNLEVTRRHLLDPLPRARIIQNPLRWQPGDITTWPDNDTPHLATVSRLAEGKGIQVLLHALALLPTVTAWRLNIYGAGPAEEYLRATVAHLGLGSRVTFRGYVSQLRDIWSSNQLLVSPSIDDGVPMTIPEALLCQRPVLATAVGGAEDWLRDGETGFLCPAPTVPLLRDSLVRAFAEQTNWKAMGQAGAVSAQTRYRPDDYLSLIA